VSVHNAENIRDDYLIGKVLGSGKLDSPNMGNIGAFGEVRLCTHRKTGAKRAVKIIKKSFLQGKEEARFLQEIDILKTMVSFFHNQYGGAVGSSEYRETFRSVLGSQEIFYRYRAL
jgi:serine/threonine protein kinase